MMHRKDSALTMAVVHRGARGDIKGCADAFGVRTGMAAPTLLVRKGDVKSAPQHAPTLLSSAARRPHQSLLSAPAVQRAKTAPNEKTYDGQHIYSDYNILVDTGLGERGEDDLQVQTMMQKKGNTRVTRAARPQQERSPDNAAGHLAAPRVVDAVARASTKQGKDLEVSLCPSGVPRMALDSLDVPPSLLPPKQMQLLFEAQAEAEAAKSLAAVEEAEAKEEEQAIMLEMEARSLKDLLKSLAALDEAEATEEEQAIMQEIEARYAQLSGKDLLPI